MLGKWVRRCLWFASIPVLLILSYLAFALLGALIPAYPQQQPEIKPRLLEPAVYLVGTMLHTDIAIPVNSLSLHQFEFLREAGMPLDNPALKYLVVGWGSREFYTQTASYSDIRFSTSWKAATGDASVMHVAPAGDLAKMKGVRKVEMTERGFAKMLEFIVEGFSRSEEEPVLLEATFGFGDVFYESRGRFNIFNPCNIWTAKALRKAGVTTGIWTPTTFSINLSLAVHN